MIKVIRRYQDQECELVQTESGNWFYRNYGLMKLPTKTFYTWAKWQELGKIIKIERSLIKWENLNGNLLHKSFITFYFTTDSFMFSIKERKHSLVKYRLPY